MATFTEEVSIDVDLYDFDDDEIVQYLEDKGYFVSKAEQIDDSHMEEAIHRWNRKEYAEALVQIEMAFPQLFGLHKLVKS